MKTAIDVVLLPYQEAMAKIIAINRETAENKIVLDEHECLPHISLCMGVINDIELDTVKNTIAGLCKNFSVVTLTAEQLQSDIIATGETVSGISVTNTPELQKLQTTIMDRLWAYLSYDVNRDMFFDPSSIEDVTFTWVRGYAKKHDNPALFHPHITVGLGDASILDGGFPWQFSAPTLAICQLGNYCTCRKVLAKFQLAL